MIESFKDREAAKIFLGEASRKLPHQQTMEDSLLLGCQHGVVRAVEITDYH